MKTVYALLIAIDEYPIPSHRLNGCVNDLTAVENLLKRRFEDSDPCKLELRTLKNGEATREGIIAGFDHFSPAKDKDICLLYYSGHGSRVGADPAFWHEEPDRMHESIVCFDSRLPGGRDLLDKELSYLIWKVTQGKDLHFTAIFDCCHSGTNTRDAGIKARMAEPNLRATSLERYLGFEHYRQLGQGLNREYTPPRGRHVHFAAAKASETAKELRIEGQTRGIFTYTLIQLLEEWQGTPTYDELLHSLKNRIAAQVDEQTPQLDATTRSDVMSLFLNGGMSHQSPRLTVDWDSRKNAWTVNAGSIHGLTANPPTLLQIENSDVSLEVTSVEPGTATLKTSDQLDKRKNYRAWIQTLPARKLAVAIDPESDAEGVLQLEKARKSLEFAQLDWKKDPADAQYLIRALEGSYRLTKPGSDRPVFRRVKDFTENSALEFLSEVETVAKWHHTSTIANPRSNISDQDIEIELFILQEAGSHYQDDQAPADKIPNWRTENIFRYDYINGQWQPPAFRLRVTNRGKRAYHLSALYLGDDFSVSNRFLPPVELGRGESAWLIDRPAAGSSGEYYEYKSIELRVDEAYQAWGISEITDHLKIIVGTAAFTTDEFNQDGLEPDVPEFVNKKAGGRPAAMQASQPDWRTFDLNLTIVRPLDSTPVAGGQSVTLAESLKITLPGGVSGIATLSALPETGRALAGLADDKTATAVAMLERSLQDTDKKLVSLREAATTGPELTIVELHQMAGRELVSADTPIGVQLPATGEDEVMIAFGLDPETGLFYPLGGPGENGQIFIETLPEETPSGTKSLGGSIKICFQKLVLSKLGFTYDHPQLALAVYDDTGENFRYETDPAIIKAAIAPAQRVILMTHGIIGDTLDMPKSLRRIHTDEGKTFDTLFDAVLTFDYENLNTEIEQTAEDLKAKLEAVGLGPHHSKHLTVVAHSMGGLVSRWMIEKEDGTGMVQHLVQVGTPNAGSPWSSVYELASTLLSKAVMGAAFLKPYTIPLSFIGKALDKMFITLLQMHEKKSEFLKKLNDGADPGMQHTIVAGNTRLIPTQLQEQQDKILKKIVARFKQRGHYDALDLLLFRQPNDIAVSINSIYGVAGIDQRAQPVARIEVACDHISYFADPAGLEGLRKALLKSTT